MYVSYQELWGQIAALNQSLTQHLPGKQKKSTNVKFTVFKI